MNLDWKEWILVDVSKENIWCGVSEIKKNIFTLDDSVTFRASY
jgi:hypothetical protein